MSVEDVKEEIPTQYIYVGGAMALVILVYSLVLRQIILGLFGVFLVLFIGMSLVVVQLLYRLVAAIERISYKL